MDIFFDRHDHIREFQGWSVALLSMFGLQSFLLFQCSNSDVVINHAYDAVLIGHGEVHMI